MSPALRAAVTTAAAHGVTADRCEILQDRSTLVVRLTDSLVARVVQDKDGPRQGDAWFARENAVAMFLASLGAPVIPLHSELPPGPYETDGFTLNFWQFVTRVEEQPAPTEVGRTLKQCHDVLRQFAQPLPELAIPREALELLETLAAKSLMAPESIALLRERLTASLEVLTHLPRQPLHGDAFEGNFLNTTQGLLWTDWEDVFSGPIEWDLACAIWNPRVMDEDHATADGILAGYRAAGGNWDESALHHALIARAAVMCAWYPILYPQPDEGRRRKLEFRLEWLRQV